MTFTEIAHKKVAGIPVLYLAAAAVAILAVVAWKMKPTASPEPPSDNGGSVADNAIDPTDYSGLATQGTVTVQPSTTPTDANPSITSNSDWVSKGVQWLVAEGKADGTTAVTALSNYINDSDLTFDQNTLVNLWIKQAGPPPDGVAGTSHIGGAPAKKQFDKPPGSHTVTNENDDTFSKIALLYYGNGSPDSVDLLEFSNPGLGTGTLAVGTRVTIPVYHTPVYWIVPSKMSWAQAASMNSETETQLRNLNNGPAAWRNAPTLDKGRVIRVK